MKNKMILSSLIFSLFISGSAFSQMLDKGNFLIGSTVGFSTSDSKVERTVDGNGVPAEGPSSLQVSVAPNIGYFLMDNFALGIGMDYTFSSIEEPDLDKTDDSDLLFGPFVRYYVPFDNEMAFFLETNFGFGNSSDDQIISGEKQSITTNVFAVGAGPGITIFSRNGIGIEAVFKYNYAKSDFTTESGGVTTSTSTKTNQFDVSLGIQFYFGGLRMAGR